ncbi:MAG: hypothetical protein ABEK16_01595 [Candidatus Nanohalobium sp.]
MDTGIAFSQEGKEKEEIFEGVLIKQRHIEKLKPMAKSALGSTEKFRLKLFATAIFMLTQEYAATVNTIVIDREWDGKEGLIKNYLYHFYQRNLLIDQKKYPEIRVEEVHQAVEGTPYCHELAYDIREGNKEPYIVSNFSFLKGMVLPSAGNGRNT